MMVGEQVELGPVDLGCALVVVDCQEADMPIIYANESFSLMTRCVCPTLFTTLMCPNYFYV